MKQQIENIIKKNLPENKKKSFIKSSGIGMNNDAYKHYSGIVDGFNQALSQIPISLIADEVLKVVVEKNREALRELVSALHKEFVYTSLATKEQWNESIAPKLRDLALSIEGYPKGTPTARNYKYNNIYFPNKENENNG